MTRRSGTYVARFITAIAVLVLTAVTAAATDDDTSAGVAVLRDWNSNVYVDSKGREIVGPPADVQRPQPAGFATVAPQTKGLPAGAPVPLTLIPATTTTGPYRRVFTRPGYTYFIGRVTLPCMAAHLPGDGTHDEQVGFVYTGGWGATARGAFVDAGFQKNSFQTGPPRDHYSMFIAFASVAHLQGTLKYKTSPRDPDLKPYPCGQDLTVEFYSDSDRLLHLNVSGVDENKRQLDQTITQATSREDGWDPAGGGASDGVEIKRMVSIAYAKTGRIPGQWYFGHARQALTPLIRWHDMKVGRYGITPHEWRMSDTWGCQNVPDDSLFRVSFNSYADEAASIDLAPPNGKNALGGKRPIRRGVPPGCPAM